MNNKAPIFLENNKFLRIILKLYIRTLISKTIIKVTYIKNWIKMLKEAIKLLL